MKFQLHTEEKKHMHIHEMNHSSCEFSNVCLICHTNWQEMKCRKRKSERMQKNQNKNWKKNALGHTLNFWAIGKIWNVNAVKFQMKNLHWRENPFISIVFQLKGELVYYSRAHARSRKRACKVYFYNLIGWNADVCVCVCVRASLRARTLQSFCIIFSSVICSASTNRLIKLITDWTFRRKMMEWIEHKLSNGWKAIDWINTNEQHEHKHAEARLGKKKGKKPVHR